MKASKKKVFGSVEEVFEYYVGKRKGMRNEEKRDDRHSGIHLAEDLLKHFQRAISQSADQEGNRPRQKRVRK
jgi:hypothetical protein